MTAPIALGYAQALLKASLKQGSVEKLAKELPAVAPLISRHAVFFFNPRIAGREKAALLREALSGRADGLLVEFLVLLAQRRHLRHLSDIQPEFEKLAAAALGKATVSLRIPYQPGKAMLDKLRAYLAERGLFPPGKKSGVRFEIQLDKSLIGGFIAECGGWSLDASIKTRLVRVEKGEITCQLT